MKIKLSPLSTEERLTAEVNGDTLVLNGTPLNFSPLGEGDILPISAIDSPWIASM